MGLFQGNNQQCRHPEEQVNSARCSSEHLRSVLENLALRENSPCCDVPRRPKLVTATDLLGLADAVSNKLLIRLLAHVLSEKLLLIVLDPMVQVCSVKMYSMPFVHHWLGRTRLRESARASKT